MIVSGIAQRYAKALLQAALEASVADDVFADTQGLLELLTQNPSFRDFLSSPQVATAEKLDIIKRTFEGRSSKLIVELLNLLVEKKRFMFVEEIVEAYRDLFEKHKGIIEVRAVSAVPLNEPEKDKLLRKLEDQTQKTIRLITEVDPEIIGGMIIQLENQIIDGSVKHKLELYQRHLMETRVVQIDGPQDGAVGDE